MTSNFLQFDPNAVNILSDADYNASGQRINGVQTGLAQSSLQNKFQYQASTMVAALGEALSDAGETVSDSNLGGLITSITSVFANAFATVGQTITGASSILSTTPASVAGLWIKGSDIASNTTITISSSGGGFFHVTGTTTITGISEVTSKNGRAVRLVFDGILTLTHNATSLILPTGANIVTAAGDEAVFVQEDATNNYWRCVSFQRKTGLPVQLSTVAAKSSGYTLVAADYGNEINCTSSFTLAVTAAATLGASWFCYVKNVGSGVITIDPNSSETVDGLTTITIGPGNGCILYCNGSSLQTIGRPPEYIWLRDQKSTGTAGGTFTTGAFRTRDLNTEAADTANNCTLSSNQFTLTAGTYRIRVSAPCYAVGYNTAILYNTTDSSTVITGTNEGGSTQANRADVSGTFTITASKTFEIRHQGQVTRSTDGFGFATSFSNIEVYTNVELWKTI